MQLSRFEHLYLRFLSSDVSFEFIAINLITSVTCVINKSVDLLSELHTIAHQGNKVKMVHATRRGDIKMPRKNLGIFGNIAGGRHQVEFYASSTFKGGIEDRIWVP